MKTNSNNNSNNSTECKHNFYKCMANYADIQLSKDEVDLISKGLKYS